MEYCCLWEGMSVSDGWEIPCISCTLTVYYHVHKNSKLVCIFSQMNPVYTLHPLSVRSITILSSHLCLGLTSSLFASGFQDTWLVTNSSSISVVMMPLWMQALVPGWWLSRSSPSKMYNALLVQWHPPFMWPTLPVNLCILSQFSCNCFHLNCTLESSGTSISWQFPVPCRNPPNTQLCIALFSFYGNELFSNLPNPEVGCSSLWLSMTAYYIHNYFPSPSLRLMKLLQ